ncbi:MAG: hypothetical protein AVDCRST_MAG87-1357 [uncultured Thermomicrobiales bacterium]|uniref:Tetratrico peptide repeat group 5 domain-containing protein n=1 Tax=uncultured Thermomicrobiales bacterium TaxID=1645740 RepID=A0A6J4UWE6_9BACT|nr:MAG: hypothetical protein AVDCRST_MAG87-1357 [uncultured Thermomicrobiales bacterium]
MDGNGDTSDISTALNELRERASTSPEDADAWFSLGSALDNEGLESEAIEAYDRVLALGFERLPEARRPELFVQAGSTLRNLGRLNEALALLEHGRMEWPGFRALTAFLALVELSAGNDRRAALLLLQDAAGDHSGDASLRRYGRSLRAYAADLEPDGE